MKYLLDPIFKQYVDFKTRANRKQFWLWTLWTVIIYIVFQIFIAIGGAMESSLITGVFSVLFILFNLAILLPNLAISVRRLHDIDRSGWWVLIGLIPFIGAVVLLIFDLLPGTPEENRFGPVPQA